MFIIGRGETRGSGAEKRPSACEIAAFPVRGRKGQTVLVSEDEHPRETTFEKLASLPAPLRSNGTVTAGNALGVNDGAQPRSSPTCAPSNAMAFSRLPASVLRP